MVSRRLFIKSLFGLPLLGFAGLKSWSIEDAGVRIKHPLTTKFILNKNNDYYPAMLLSAEFILPKKQLYRLHINRES